MKQLSILPVLFLTLLFSGNPVFSADSKKGGSAAQKKDFSTALKQFKLLAKQGDSGAQYNLGLMYDNGQGVGQNYKTAIKWYKLAAKQGNATASLIWV